MFTKSPRRFVESSISGPMYWLGVTTLSVTHGSSIASMSVGVGQLGRVVDLDDAAAVGQDDVVFDRRRRGDEVEVELALEPLLDDLHVEQAEEPAAEPEAERDRALGFVGEARVVEVQLLEGIAQQRVVLAGDRVDAGEDEALRGAGSRGAASAPERGARDGVADLRVADALEARWRRSRPRPRRAACTGTSCGRKTPSSSGSASAPDAHEADRVVRAERALRRAARRR